MTMRKNIVKERIIKNDYNTKKYYDYGCSLEGSLKYISDKVFEEQQQLSISEELHSELQNIIDEKLFGCFINFIDLKNRTIEKIKINLANKKIDNVTIGYIIEQINDIVYQPYCYTYEDVY